MHLRREGRTVSPDDAKVMTVSHGFYHANWNTTGKGTPHRYDVQVLRSAPVVVDSTTGLMWQRDGSGPQLMDRQEAKAYARSLNARKFGGFDDWRLPTLEEAMSLITPPEDGRSNDSRAENASCSLWEAHPEVAAERNLVKVATFNINDINKRLDNFLA
ncbi:MAG TPA: DUF1566 domain-containing protein, partial [Candidatus Solibacter sp.]|nr:DUF1566 domain-containing protein [Candidatus Solibacter sp.]